MHTTAKIVALCVWLGSCAYSPGQGSTSLPPTIAAPDDDFSKPPELPRYPAKVEFTGGKLNIVANNSSLNQILTEIASKVGMKITGSVPEQRVFGTYGPADPATVVASLLTGAHSNMLLWEDRRRMPRELFLTPRNGDPSPPSPSSSSTDEADTEDLPPELTPRFKSRLPQPEPTPEPTQPTGLPASAPTNQATPPPGTTTQQIPNGARTPQQIYDQLVQMQQKNAPTAPN